ncbi:hypothetical protein F7725_023825, partial [Dissostichus mawsoni]
MREEEATDDSTVSPGVKANKVYQQIQLYNARPRMSLAVPMEGLSPPVGPQLPEHGRFERLGLQTVGPSREVWYRPLHQVLQTHNHLLRHRNYLQLKLRYANRILRFTSDEEKVSERQNPRFTVL